MYELCNIIFYQQYSQQIYTVLLTKNGTEQYMHINASNSIMVKLILTKINNIIK